MIISENNLQKWLFDYFESNLTPLERIEVEQFIKHNPVYQDEFEAWEKSYGIQNSKESRKTPIYAGASTLMVETSIWARFNWRYAAIFLLLLGGGAIGYFTFPTENQAVSLNNSQDVVTTPKDLLVNTEKNKDNFTLLNNVNNTNVVRDASETNQTKHSNRGSNYVSNVPSNNLSTNSSNQSLQNAVQSLPLIVEDVFIAMDPSVAIAPERIIHSDTYKKTSSIKATSIQSELSGDLGQANKKKSSRKGYYYQGFKNVAGRGIRANSKSKKRSLEGKDVDQLISENNTGEKSKDKGERSHKKAKKSTPDLALSNLYDPIFIQTKGQPLQVNAALTGQLGLPRLKTTHRLQQTNSKDQAFNSTSSFDMYISELKAGVGIIAEQNNYNAGMYKNKNLGIVYAQLFEIDRESSFSVALKYTLGNNTLNKSKLVYDSEIEVEKGEIHSTFLDKPSFESTSKITSDLGIGLWYNGQYLYGGFNIDNLLTPKAAVYNSDDLDRNEKLNINAQIGTDYRKSEFSKLVVSPQVSYRQHGNFKNLWVGSTVKYGSLVAGLGVGTLNSTSFKGMLGLQNYMFRINYSLDYANSTLEKGMFVSHEISLRILFGAQKNNWSRF